MRLVFLAGPYHSQNPMQIEDNILNAKRAAVECVNRGIAVFTPHLNYAQFNHLSTCSEEYFREFDMEFLKRMDAILLLMGWSLSKGATAEYDWWRENRDENLIFCMQGYDRLPSQLVDWYFSTK